MTSATIAILWFAGLFCALLVANLLLPPRQRSMYSFGAAAKKPSQRSPADLLTFLVSNLQAIIQAALLFIITLTAVWIVASADKDHPAREWAERSLSGVVGYLIAKAPPLSAQNSAATKKGP